MTVYDVVARLTSSGLKLRVNNGSLQVNAPKGAMTPELAQLIGDNKDQLVELFGGMQDKEHIPPVAEKDYYTLSSAQKRMYFLQDFDGGSVAYNIPEVIRVEGQVDENRLRDTFNKLVARHESLRTSFGLVNEEVVQYIAPTDDFTLEKYTAKEEAIQDIINAFVRPFDLSQAPLIRVGLITFPPNQPGSQAILLVDMHHIICDGVSHSILARDFMLLYNGAALNRLTVQYKDYAEWQQDAGRQAVLEKQRAFWLKAYEEEPSLLTLPSDFPRPKHRGYEGASLPFSIDPEERDRLKAIAHAEGVTLYMIILAVYNILLAKLCNEEDVIVGTPTAGRQHPDLDGVIGMFVNTLCLRNSPLGTLTFKQFLGNVKKNTLACFDNQDYQYETLIVDLKLARDTRRNPLFDVMFSYQNIEKQQFELADLKLLPFGQVQSKSKFDLTLRAGEQEGQLYFDFNYATELFKESTIARFVDYFKKIIQTVTADPEVMLRDIDVLSKAEKERLLLTFNDTKRDFPEETTVIALYEQQSAQTPLAIALAQDGRQMSYQALNESANQVAHFLAGRGVGAGSVVGLMIDRSMEMVIGILGILKTGGAYLPLNGDHPEGRNLQLLQDSGASLLLTESAHLDSFKPHMEVVDIRGEALGSSSKENLEIGVLPTSLAYVLYTSGSTGKPKGVLIGHRAVVNMVYSQKARYAITEADTILLFSAVTFDASVQQMWLALLSGARLVTVDKDVLLNQKDFNRYLIDQHITHLHVTPSFLDVIDLQGCAQLKRVVLGGEAFRVNARHQVEGGFDFYNSYGPTENTVTSVSCKVSAQDIGTGSVPIGKPIHNIQAYVLGKSGELLPEGTIGELYLGGDGLAKGYLNDATLTNEKFVDNPFGEGKMYKTGDFVRWLPDGQLLFMGRIDDQVKIRGYRIELEEISNVLQQYEGVSSAVVLAREHFSDKYLIAYYVSERAINTAAFKSYLSGTLPEYMVPTYYVQLKQIPLTPSGKVDKKSLPDPVLLPDDDYVGAGNAEEEQLVDLWSEVLKLDKDQISVTKSFFELGGHSLRAAFLINKIRKHLRVEVSLKDFFSHQSIVKLALFIKGLSTVTDTVIEKAALKDHYALSSAQSRMYFLQAFDKQSVAYNMPQVVRLEGHLDQDRLNDTFKKLIGRHEILRTSFGLQGERVVQYVSREVDFQIARYKSREDQVSTIIDEFIRPFDLSSDCLLRVGLIAISATSHVLMVDMHHIVSDGVSMGIMIREFMALYNHELLAPLDLQYKDYAEWQNRQIQQERISQQRAFWLETFADEIAPLRLPADFARPAIRSFSGGYVSFQLAQPAYKQLKAVGEKEGATLFMTTLAAFGTLLSKLANTEDLVVGTPTAGRPHSDLEHMIGMFVNTLCIRSYPQGQMSFKEYLREVKSSVLACFENELYPYEELINDLQVVRDASHNPLFDVMFSYQNFEPLALNIPGLTLTSHGDVQQTAKFDLSLGVTEKDESLFFTFNYSTELFTRATVERFAHYLENIVTAVISDPEVMLRDIDVLSKKEKHQLLVAFNDTRVDYPRNVTITDLIETQVKRTPQAIALVYEGRSLTYQRMNERANSLARELRKNGVMPDDIVCIMAAQSLEMIIGVLAILKAGAVFLPIDAEYPPQRIAYMLADSGAKVLLAQAGVVAQSGYAGQYIDLEEEAVYTHANTDLSRNTAPQDLAYVIYTSGSTGTPKGTMIRHRSLVNLSYWHNQAYQVSASDKSTKYAGFAFDASVWEIFPYLIKGASIHIIAQAMRLDLEALNEYYQANEITISFLPSLLCEQFARLSNTSLRVLLTGGDKLNAMGRTGYEVVNNYGPTENTVVTTSFALAGEGYSDIPIGKPVHNVQLYVLDQHRRLVGVGVEGELYIGGDGLSAGYLNNHAMTDEKFVLNPYATQERIFKTGDLVKWLPDGNVAFIGRADDQVKMRGFRIELGEIQHQLLDYPDVQAAVVVVREREAEKYLVAYLVAQRSIEEGELRAYLSARLPDYMVPTYYVQLKQLPLTPNGKVDKKSLPDPVLLADDDYVGAGNAVEEQLVDLWSEVLKLDKDQISVTKSFFELGGHSLRAAFLINKIRKHLRVEVSLKDFFSHQSIAKLALFVKGLSTVADTVIEKAALKDHYALSSAQSRMYFLQAFDKQSVAYNMPYMVNVSGDLDQERIVHTFNRLISRHESLRTSFGNIDVAIFQQIHDAVSIELEYFESDRKSVEAIIESFVRPFDLKQAPLVRVGLIRVNESEHVLMMDMHHIITDGVSQGILVQDFMRLYNNEPLPALAFQYKDYSEWQQGRDQQAEMQRHKLFWHGAFEGEVPVLNLPMDFRRPTEKKHDGGLVNFSLGIEETAKLKLISEQAGATMFMTLLSVSYVLLAKLSNQEDIVVGTPVAGRQHADFEGIIGMFVNTLPLRNYPEADLSFSDFLQQVKSVTLACFEHQAYQYERLIDELKIERDTSRNPLFDVTFSYQQFDGAGLSIPGLHISAVENSRSVSKFDLSLAASEAADGVFVNISYSTDLFRSDTIHRFVGYFKKIVSFVICDVQAKLGDIDVISPEEKDLLLLEFNNTGFDNAVGGDVVRLFEKQVLDGPENTALVFNGEKISYRELNEKSNNVAHFLMEKGLGPGDIVCVLADQSFEMFFGLMGILKSGAAYLPIDSHYPKDRIEYILKDSRCSALLSFAKLIEDLDLGCDYIDLRDPMIHAASRQPRSLKLRPTDLAYVIYTSGSTGRPKGVMVEHHALLNLCHWYTVNYEVTVHDITTKYAAFGFDASVMEIFPYLIKGACIHIIEEQLRLDIKGLNDYYNDNQVTISFLPTQVCEQFTHFSNSSLRVMLTGGDKLGNVKATRYKIVNNYGPTENTVVATAFELNEQTKQPIPIGKPIHNNKIYILGSDDRLLPLGVVGQLCIGGRSLARGYLHDDGLTQTRFVKNPFSPAERMYKTGDLACWRSDGNLEFMGRVDEQVKIRGFRIEPGEIEYHLNGYELVKESVVLAKEISGDKYLVAYYTADGDLDAGRLRQYLLGKLPGYMVPGYFVRLEQIPMTQNGKVNKMALPLPVPDRQSNHEKPSNETEERLVELWSEILKLDAGQISVNSNFFDIGGHSLKAIQIVAAVFRELKRVLTLRDIFNNPTIRGISGILTDQHQGRSLIVKLNKIDSGHEDVFFIPPVIGSSTVFRNVAVELNQHYNVYGIQYRGFDDEDAFDRSIEEMAETFAGEVKSTAKSRSISLIGYSMGVPIAFEMAKILEKEGYSLKLVFIDRGVSYQSKSGKWSDGQLNQLLEAEIARWTNEVKELDSDRIRDLILNNYRVLNGYQVSGVIASDIFAIEALRNHGGANMNDWRKCSRGDFRHVFMDEDHYGLLEARNTAALAEFITMALSGEVGVKS